MPITSAPSVRRPSRSAGKSLGLPTLTSNEAMAPGATRTRRSRTTAPRVLKIFTVNSHRVSGTAMPPVPAVPGVDIDPHALTHPNPDGAKQHLVLGAHNRQRAATHQEQRHCEQRECHGSANGARSKHMFLLWRGRSPHGRKFRPAFRYGYFAHRKPAADASPMLLGAPFWSGPDPNPARSSSG